MQNDTLASINASELRIGNIVNSFTINITEVKNIHESGINYENKFDEDLCTDYEVLIPFDHLGGIPLTPEILEKCGFDIVFSEGDEVCYQLNGISIIHRHPDYQLCDQDAYLGSVSRIGVPFRHLHQLQNLFYCLVGEELKIEL